MTPYPHINQSQKSRNLIGLFETMLKRLRWKIYKSRNLIGLFEEDEEEKEAIESTKVEIW